MSQARKKRFLRPGTALGIGLAMAIVAGVGVGCRSLSKPRLEAKLLELGKNAPVTELQRREIQLDLDGESRTYELVYLHVPMQREGTTPGTEPVDATPAVLVHGTPSTLFTWTELVFGREGDDGFEGLRATRDVYAIEVIGHGVAPGTAAPYTFERCARFVTAAIRGLGLERVHLVGSSYGGEFVWRAALDEPELIESLVLIDSSGYTRREEDWLPEEVVMRENSLAKIGWMLNSRERITTALAPHFDVIPPDRVDEFFLVCENAHNWKAMIDLARDENGTREAEIPDIQAPTLVLWGAEDIAYHLDVYGERFARDIPRAELLALPGTGHYPHEERPREVIGALNRFFDSTGPRR